MAIERKAAGRAKPVAFDDEVMAEEVVTDPNAEGIDNETVDAVEAPAEGGETVTLDMAMLGGQKVAPGDVVRLEVVSASDEDGTVVVKYASPNKTGGIAKASAAFNEGP